jgi:hypothetical protein
MQYDVTDPSAPSAPTVITGVPGHAIDIASEETSPDTGGGLVAVATGAGILAMPSNIFFYDASDPNNVHRVGAVSVTSSAAQVGTILRMVVRDSFAYTSTHRKGIQVVDIRRAIANYQAAVQSDIVQFGFQVSQDGEGFGMDAVVNTIPVMTSKFGTPAVSAVLFDLKTGTYVLDPQGNPQGQTLVVATGIEALVVADPVAGQVIAQLSNLVLPGGTLTNGQVLALGTITAPCPSGAPFNIPTCNVAVVGGRGDSGAMVTLVDMSDPTHPVPVSTVPVAEIPSDVLMNGNLALVAQSNSVQLIDFSDPTHPQLAGTIAGVGGRLTLSDSGILFSTGLANPSQFGIHTSAFMPLVTIPPVAPLFSQQVVVGNQNYIQTLVKLNLNPRLVGANADPSGGIIQIFDNGVKVAERAVQFVGNTAQVVFDKGLQLLLNTKDAVSKFFTAIITVQTDRGPLTSQRQIQAGMIKIMLDNNNDTLIDQNDDPAPQGQVFSFWEADPALLNDPDGHGLVDFARVRLQVGALPDPKDGSVFLKLSGVNSWDLVRNVGITDNMSADQIGPAAKKFLSDKSTTKSQLDRNKNRQLCGSGNALLGTPNFSVVDSFCVSDSDSISLIGLTTGKTYDLLFRCRSCQVDQSRMLSIKTVSRLDLSPDGIPTATEQPGVKVDIRPMSQWVGAYSARASDPPDPQLAPVAGWSNTLPSSANVTVLVHGFKVSESNALKSFIPRYAKRLYWSGHQILPVQKDQSGRAAYTVGILWHGDFTKPSMPVTGLYFPDDEFRALQSGVPIANFLQQLSGGGNQITVIAHSLGNMAVNSALTRPGMTGVVKQYMMNEGAVPLEAFTVSDVFSTNPQIPAGSEQFQPNIFRNNRAIFMQGHLLEQGFPDDQLWSDQLQAVLAFPPNCNEVGCTVTPLDVFNQYYDIHPFPNRNTHYQTRWTKQRPGKVAPASDSSLATGPWNGFFAGNLAKTTVYNSFNVGDCILNNPWFANELFQKPDRSSTSSIADAAYAFSHRFGGPFPTDRHTDTIGDQSWLNLEPPFPASLLGDSASHYGIHRQWTELAYWYPARSGPVGISNGRLSDGTNVFGDAQTLDLTAVGEPDAGQQCFIQDTFSTDTAGSISDAVSFLFSLGSHTETHSYMIDKPFWQTWPAYKQYFSKLDQGRKDPDPPVNMPPAH